MLQKGSFFFLSKLSSKEKDLWQMLPGINYHELNYSSWLCGHSCSAYEKGDLGHEGDSSHSELLILFVPLLSVRTSRKVEYLDHPGYWRSSGQILINDLSQYPCECWIHSNKPWYMILMWGRLKHWDCFSCSRTRNESGGQEIRVALHSL